MAEVGQSEGTPLPKVTTVHEKTVQSVARGETEPVKRKRRNNGRRRLAITTRSEKVPDIGMAAALALAGGDASRLRIINGNEVVVTNTSREEHRK